MGVDSAGPGYWSAVTFDDVRAVSRNQETFSSASGVISNDPTPEFLAVGSIIVMADPRHTKLRRLVQKSIGDALARALLAGEVRDGDEVVVDRAEGGEGLSVGPAVRADV